MKFRLTWKQAIPVFSVFFVLAVLIIAYPHKVASTFGLSSLFCSSPELPQGSAEKKENKFNEDGTIQYFFDDFSTYASSTKVIDDFELMPNLDKHDKYTVELSKDHVSGAHSLRIDITDASTSDIDLIDMIGSTSVSDGGYFTAWLNVKNRENISGVSLTLIDDQGNERNFNKLNNLIGNIPNYYDADDVYPNLKFNSYESSSDVWTDFWINSGWNYLIWSNKKGNYKDIGSFDTSHIEKIKVTFSRSTDNKFEFLLDNIRYVSGLQKKDNPLAPNWYEPLGRPQYGVFDVTSFGDKSSVNLINVRQSQYLSNGDHARMLTKGLTPENFELKTRFRLYDVGTGGNELLNTWVRLMYDFDPDYDPGHDWFGVFSSLEWKNTGLITVIPIQRFYLQDQEPSVKDIGKSSKDFVLKGDQVYEIQMKVVGQDAEVWIYAMNDGCLSLVSNIKYSFNRKRSAEKRYPFAFEVTGNVKAQLYTFEVKQI